VGSNATLQVAWQKTSNAAKRVAHLGLTLFTQ
jgi:hypothetical protein